MTRCGACRREVQPDDPRDACPACGYDGYSDDDAHGPQPTRDRPAYDDSQSFDIRELARDRA